ncbi:MAG: hypothetical protein GYA60_05865 [Candidatus Methanofastidiosa archaeon]|nr:hypothetical protein [Candidatus Methanofastidiosa archaeon]
MNDTDENKYGKFKPEEKKKIMPELVLGHLDSIGDREKYERITDKVEYFGDYSWSSENLFIYKKKEN